MTHEIDPDTIGQAFEAAHTASNRLRSLHKGDAKDPAAVRAAVVTDLLAALRLLGATPTTDEDVGRAVMEALGFPAYTAWGGDAREVMAGLREYSEAWADARGESEDEDCGACLRCLDGVENEAGWPVTASMMIVCPRCGHKRCPKATDHRNACSGSNEPGQPGSAYGGLDDAVRRAETEIGERLLDPEAFQEVWDAEIRRDPVGYLRRVRDLFGDRMSGGARRVLEIVSGILQTRPEWPEEPLETECPVCAHELWVQLAGGDIVAVVAAPDEDGRTPGDDDS